MHLLRSGILCCCILLAFGLSAQQTTTYTEANAAYKRGMELFEQGVYAMAQREFTTAIELLRPANEPEWRDTKTSAALFHAKCAVRLDQPEAEKLVLDFLREASPSPVANQAALEIGDYYFNEKKFDQALRYYGLAPAGSGAARDELRFKEGYCFFVTKKFAQAKLSFSSLKDNSRSEWYYPANYYYGCCAFYENKYDEAAQAFQRCESSDKYKQVIPYYLCQIFAAKKQYDQVISYGAPKAGNADLKNRAELNQLVGQAYYEKGDYKKAQPYLEFAANNGARFRPADFYQIGYTQYQNGFYKQAIENFEQLSKQDSLLGQNGLYHLGDCYLRTKNKFAARNAFGQAANMRYDQTVREDALMNYAKLSYELKYDRDAIDALQKFQPASKYFDEAQALMGQVFLNTRDYERAISSLEGVKDRSRQLTEAYQKVCYLRGVQLYQNNTRDEARRLFNKAVENPVDKRTATLASFWLGTISHEAGEYEISKQHLNAFLNQAKNYNDLPEETSLMMGNYVQGYNFLKQKSPDYNSALTNFRSTVDAIKRNQNSIASEQIRTAILGDATLRAGDCHFKRNQYNDALTFYNDAISRKYEGFQYALYQKAIIKGLQREPLDKIVALEDLVQKYPQGRYTDEALYELGETYQSIDKLDQAQAPLKRLIAEFRGKTPLYNRALLRLGLISYNQGNTSAAINYYKQVFSNNPENAEAKDALAAMEEIYVRDLNRPDEYFAFLETVPGYNISTSGRDSIAFEAAEIQYKRGQWNPAIEGFSNYLAKYPNGRNALAAQYMRAECYAAVQKMDAALKDYNAVVGKGQSRYTARAAEKGALIAFNNVKDYPIAFDLAKKWEEFGSSDASRLDAQALALRAAHQLKNNSAVNDYANKILQSGVASREQRGIANFFLGKNAYDRGDLPGAYPYFEQVTKNSTTEIMAESYHLMAQILYRQRNYAKAEDIISDANKASAGYDDWIARNLLLLSDVYLDQGDRNSASAALEAILENYKGNNQEITTQAKQKYDRLNSSAPRNNLVPQQRSDGTKGIDIIDLELPGGGN
jgi:tetratricopeptide (TPR) repeat protein